MQYVTVICIYYSFQVKNLRVMLLFLSSRIYFRKSFHFLEIENSTVIYSTVIYCFYEKERVWHFDSLTFLQEGIYFFNVSYFEWKQKFISYVQGSKYYRERKWKLLGKYPREKQKLFWCFNFMFKDSLFIY